MPLDAKAIDHLALLARLSLSEAEKALFTEQLNKIVAAVEKIGALDLAGIEPLTFAVPLENVLREDVEAPSLPRKDALAMAPAHTEEGFLVPRVISEGA
jgi:aspartyl-tRNA(Asn)/glutamyl-tRNA(Gln) amidotransferase subunit C